MTFIANSEVPQSRRRRPVLRWLGRVFRDRVASEAEADPGPIAAGRDVSAYLEGLRVLVVDDNPGYLMLASELLSTYRITPLLAEDGAQAAELASEWPLDLILMDLQMPVLDGLAAAKRIRGIERECAGKRVPIVAYTSTCPNKASLRAAGIDGVLAKPCDGPSLRSCLAQWCPPAAGAVASSPVSHEGA